MGSFVPAVSAKIGIVDALFARVGASDELSRHRSTFMVEMEETAALLRGATRDSLVLIDEVGRGTAVADGLSIGIATIEHLAQSGARTLFASHFPELAATAFSAQGEGLVRVNIMGWQKGTAERSLILTHRVELHPIHEARSETERLDLLGETVSHGLAVAEHASVPKSVVNRAQAVLSSLRASGAGRVWGLAVHRALEKEAPTVPVEPI